jgi:hypothetical protein
MVHLTYFVTDAGSTIKIGTPIQFGFFLANFGLIWPKFQPYDQFGTGVGSSNLIYALTLVIIFRIVL